MHNTKNTGEGLHAFFHPDRSAASRLSRNSRQMLVLPCAMLALGSLWLAPAAAQTADASTAPEPAAGLETVVVTAQKRSEDLQSVPFRSRW